MPSASPAASTNAGLPPNSYIYKIISTAPRQDPLTYSKLDQLAIVSSDDSLRFLDPANLSIFPNGVITKVNEKVTCLERANDAPSNVVATAGRDGYIRFWDKRSRQKALEIESRPHKLISALVCDAEKNFVAAGIENPDDGPGVSPVYVWDQRNPSAPTLSLIESHTDTITSLQLHPSHPTLLLSSSTDGLVNIFDTSQAEEEDALYQVINHTSAIAHAGFMYPSTDIYALGTDETMSFYALQSQKEDEQEPIPKAFGDVREALGCEYMVDMHWIGPQPFIATGKHSKNRLHLIPITPSPAAPAPAAANPLNYTHHPAKSIRLAASHSHEIVRDLFTDIHSRITYTCGEDGHVRAWKLSDDDEDMGVGDDNDDNDDDDDDDDDDVAFSNDRREKRKVVKSRGKRKGGDGDKTRFKPY